MNNEILIVGGILLVLIIMGLMLKKKKSIEKDEKTKLAEEQFSSLKSTNKSANRTSAKRASILDKVEPTRMAKKEKAANWKDSTSYEEDLNNLQPKQEEVAQVEPNQITILLTDDSLVVRKYVGDLLQKNDYKVILKNDGQEALNYLLNTEYKPDLIISDIEMPIMNGIELVKKIRQEDRYANIPILVISAHAESHFILMEDEHIQGFIKKPFEDQDLISQINYLLK